MKYVVKELKENVNVTPHHPGKEFLKLAGWVVGGLIVLYLLLGVLVSVLAPQVSPRVEIAMGNLFNQHLCSQPVPKETGELQAILEGFEPHLSHDDRRLEYRVCVTRDSQVNAIALPGGTIVVYTGLLDKISSQNEIAFVLAHELGHFHYRHHLKGMGRALVAMFLSITLLGENSQATDIIFKTIGQVEMKFSRSQEKAADLFAVELLKKTYGNADGAAAFMKKLAAREERWRLFYYFSTHPHPAERLEYLRKAF